MTSRSTFPPDDDEDTIELELTAEEMRNLSRPARPAAIAKGRYPPWSVPLLAALIGVAVSIAWRSSPPRYVAQRPAASLPLPVPVRAAPPASQPTPLAALQVPVVSRATPGRPVRVKNPFDPQEVFEFPPGTTKDQAREKIRELLLQRAVDRNGQHMAARSRD